MNRRLSMWVGAALVLLTAASCRADEVFPVVHNEPIAVRVVDGKTGKPQARAHVLLVAGYNRHDLAVGLWREEAKANEAGLVMLSNSLRNLPLLRVEVLNRRACAADEGLSVERIRRDGLSGANRCGTAAVENAPGEITVFVTGGKAGAQQDAREGKAGAALATPRPETADAAMKPAPVAPLTDAEVAEILAERH